MNQPLKYFNTPIRPLFQDIPEEAPQNTQGTMGDMVDNLQANTLNAVGGMFDMVGAKGLASQFYGWSEDQSNQISDSGRESMGKQIFSEDEEGNLKLGEGASDLDTWLLMFAGAAGQMIPTMIPGAGAAGLATKALTLGKVGSKIATGVGMGATGGSAATGQGMEQAREEIRNMPNKLKAESPIFQELIRGIHAQNPDATPQEKWKLATEALAEQVANEVRSDPKVLLANFGASAIGDPIIGRALVGARIAKSGAIRSAFKGFATEGTTEAAQAGVQQYGINEAIRPIDNRDLMQGVKSAAANEGIMGGAFGGAAGGLGGVVNRQTEKPLVDTEQAPSVEPTQTRQPDPATEAVKASNPILGDVLDQFDKSSNARANAINQAVNYDIPTVARQAGATTPVEVANLGRAYDDSPIQEALKKMQQGRSQTVQDMINKATQNKLPTEQDRFLPAKFEYQGEVLSQAPRQPQQRIDSGPIDGQLNIKPKALPQGQARIAQKDIVFAGNNSGVNVKASGNVFLSPKEALISKNARAAKRAGNEIEAVPFGDGFGWRVTKAVTNEQSNRLDTGSIEQPSDRQVRSLGNTLPDSQREAGQSGLRDTNGQLSRSNGADLPVSDGRNTNDNAVTSSDFVEDYEAELNGKARGEIERIINRIKGEQQKREKILSTPKNISMYAKENGVSEIEQKSILTSNYENNKKRLVSYEESLKKAVPEKTNNIKFNEINASTGNNKALAKTPVKEIAKDLSGDKIDKEWVAFADDTGTKKIPRAEMPQIKAEHRGAMINFMKGRDITHTQEEVEASSLKPTQTEFSPKKVKKALGYEGGDRSILVSSDNYVLDGHHQWLAKRQGNKPVKVIRLNAPIDQLIPLAKEFPSSELATDGVSPVSDMVPTAKVVEAKPAIKQVAKIDAEKEQLTESTPNTEPAILSQTKSKWLNQEFSKAKINKNSPGFEAAKAKIEERYDDEIDKAYAQLPFERYNELNSDTPEGINRSAYEALTGKKVDKPKIEEANPSEPVEESEHQDSIDAVNLIKSKIGEDGKLSQYDKSGVNKQFIKISKAIDDIAGTTESLKFGKLFNSTYDFPKSIELAESILGIKKTKENLSTKSVDKGVDKVEAADLANTDDVGGELSYNRRSWTGITSKDIDAATNDTEKLKMAQKEKVWKRPNYEELVANGMDAHKAYFIKLVYDAIAAKPKYKSDKQLKIYVDAVGEIRDSIEGIVKSKEFSQLYLDAIQEVAQSTRSYMSMVAAGGKMKSIGDMILDKVLPKDDKGYRWGRSNPEGNEKAVLLGNFTSKIQFGSKQLRDSVEAVMGNGWPAKQEMWQKSYEIKERNNEFLVTKKGRGKILGTFNTKEAAEQFAKDDSKTERSVQFKEPKVSLNNIKRTGPDYREGKNVSTEEVMNEFGLRGINFGNWVKGDANAKERQLHINHIYDGLMDLSDLLNIPPKAIGLNGMLGVAVGAQGNGGKFAAHFVPGLNEINITRNSGAGSLAHEWGHALDHYFAVQAGLARVEDPFLSDYSGYSRSFPGDIRPEIVEAYRSLMKAMKSKEFIETPEEVEQGRKVYFERAERDLLKGIKAARNEIERTDKSYLVEFDELANDVVNNPPGEYVAIGKTKDYADESVVKLYDLLVKARGRSADKNIFRYIESQKRSMNYAKSAEEYAKIHTPQTSVSTDFKKGAANLDGATKKPYWSTNLEMFARAFEMYVLDRLSDNGKRSDYMTAAWKRDNDRYLEHNKDAYPQDQEAVEINKAFDTLLGEIKTKEGDNGNVIMFNRSAPINGNPVSLGQAKTVTKDFIDYYTGLDDDMEITVTDKKPSEIFKNAKLEDGDDTAIKGGFDKDSNRLYIFSANHSNIEDVRKTLREELLVHKGLGVFKPEEIAKLINTINGTRNSLNPKIKAIWADIERNYGKAPELVQAEEFLGKVAQIKPSSLGKYWNQIVSTLTRLLRKVGLVRKGITFTEMQAVVAEIGDKLRQGKRTENDGFSTQEAADSGLSFEPESSLMFNRDTRTAEEKIGQGAAIASDTITQKGKKVVNALKSSEFWNRAAEGMFDGLHGIKQAEQGAGITDPTKMGYTSARLATGLGDMLHAVFHKGALEWKDGVTSIKKDTKGLLEVIGMLPEGEGLNNWLAWMAAGRAEMLSKLGKENNLTKEDIATLKAKAKGNEALFEEVRKEYNKINSATLDLAQEAGLLSPEQRGAFDEEWYVPFFREQSIDNPELTDVIKQITAPHTTKTGIVGQSAQIKELIGGKGSTKDLLENIIQRQVSMIDAAVKNNAAREIADNLAGTEYMTRDDDASINDAINTIGVSRGDLAKNFQKVRVMENGKPVYYYVSDPALLRGLLQVHDVGSKALFNKMARSAKRFLTTGITLSPDFIIRNFIRDAAHAWMVNKDGAKLGTDTWKGLKASWQGSDNYWNLIASGAAFQGGYIYGADPEAAQQQIRRALKMEGMEQKEIDGYMKTVVSTKDGLLKAFEKYRNASDKIENANRVATYEAALKAGKSNKQALFESKDLMDYSMKGNFASLGTFIDMLPFFNARLQGMYKLGRAAAADGDDQFLKVLSKDLAFKGMKVAAFSAALAALNGDDERYKELPEWDKDAHWHFFLGSGNDGHIRIPKPFELGIIFGTLPERLYNFGTGKQTGKDLGDSVIHSMVNTLSLNPIPQLAMPTLEIIMNRSFFTGSPIEGMADENREKADRYNMNTSDTARMIGQFSDAIGLSPKQVQHLITGYTGTMGGYVLSMSDFLARAMTGRTKADAAVADWPIIKTLYQGGREPRSTVYQERFYESLQKAQEAYGSYKAAIDENDPERARELFEKRAEELNDRLALNRIQRKTSEISKRMRAVDNNQSLTSKEKQKRLEDLTKLKNDLYEQAYTQLNLADW